MWQPFFLALVVAVSGITVDCSLLAPGSPCSNLNTGIVTPNLVQLKRTEVRANENYYLSSGFPCNGKRPIGLHVTACMTNRDFIPPTLIPTDQVSVVLVKTTGPATVDMIAYCEDPIDKASHPRKRLSLLASKH